MCSYPTFPTFTGDQQRRILLGHVHHVRVLGRHARVGVAQKVLHGLQVDGAQVPQCTCRMAQETAAACNLLRGGGGV